MTLFVPSHHHILAMSRSASSAPCAGFAPARELGVIILKGRFDAFCYDCPHYAAGGVRRLRTFSRFGRHAIAR
jgi:hypothetical protein